jgi:tetratricopeptide (TPR) repeat protein
MTRWRLAAALAVLLGVGLSTARAATPEAEKQARRSFERAEAHFKAGLFAEALAEYQAGYEQAPLPGFLINIAQCQRRLGDLKQARNTYRKFTLVAPDSPYVGEVQTLIAELERLMESDSDTAAPTTNPATDGEQGSGVEPPPAKQRPLPVAAAPVADVTANPLVASPADNPPPTASPTRWWLWGGIGAAVVGGAIATVYLLRSPETTTLHEGSLGTLRR